MSFGLKLILDGGEFFGLLARGFWYGFESDGESLGRGV